MRQPIGTPTIPSHVDNTGGNIAGFEKDKLENPKKLQLAAERKTPYCVLTFLRKQ